MIRQILQCLTIGITICAAVVSVANEPREQSTSVVSFTNDIVPVLTKFGCNSGVCHAKAPNGQNGFQLSLLGFEPAEDYQHLVIEGRGRRLFLAAPEHSLFLRKASGGIPHKGGVRIETDSKEYNLLVDWLKQGALYDGESVAALTAMEVEPASGLMKPTSTQQLRAIAKYSDGSQRDVTDKALFESNDKSLADVSSSGLVTAAELPGKVAIMVRYQGKTAVYNAAIPLGEKIESLPPQKNFVDELIFANLQELGIPPSALCDDSTFLRRTALDIAGRLPTYEETQSFLASTAADKRDQWIEELLRSPEYADYFANKWTSLLKNRRDDASDITSNFAFYSWVRDSLLANKPYDQFVRELLAATGTVLDNPPVAWYKRVKEPKQQLEDVAQLFLGVRMQCAQCHHHPFERWSQDDYYSMAAFFSQVGRKPTDTRGEDMIFHRRGIAQATNIKTGKSLKPAALGQDEQSIAADIDPRLKLADWMGAPDNPFFAKALVNRYWKHFLHRGLIEPEDDVRDTNPPSNPQLLAALEKHFVENHFDLKALVRVIVQSSAYQLSEEPNAFNRIDRQNYSRYYPRRLQAEVLLDAIDDLTGSRTDFPNLPAGTRAIALPDNSYNNASPFLKVFGRPANESVCECERIQSSSLSQSLHLMNANDIRGKLNNGGGRAIKMAGDKNRKLEDKVSELYLRAFARAPRADELATAVAYLSESRVDANGKPVAEATAIQENFKDLLWAMINTKEFLFNH